MLSVAIYVNYILFVCLSIPFSLTSLCCNATLHDAYTSHFDVVTCHDQLQLTGLNDVFLLKLYKIFHLYIISGISLYESATMSDNTPWINSLEKEIESIPKVASKSKEGWKLQQLKHIYRRSQLDMVK